MKLVEFTEQAEAELIVAAVWYAEVDPALPMRLFAKVEQATEAIASLPQRFPALPKPKRVPPVRRARLHHFPYALVFVELHDRVSVIAVSHLKRRPLYWLSRVPNEA